MFEELRSALLRTLPFLIVICVVLIGIKRKKINPQDIDLKDSFRIRPFLFWTVGFLLYTLLTELTLNCFGLLSVNSWNHSLYPSLILIGGAVILAPIAEEFMFRGFVLNAMTKKKVNVHLAIFIQAVFFVLLHNFTYENTLSSNIGIAQSLIDATLFGYARKYTKSLYTPIAMHMSGNLIAVLERFIL